MRKAVDTVDHDILFTKHENKEFAGWLMTGCAHAKKGRQQFACIGNEVSAIKEIVSRIPQRSF